MFKKILWLFLVFPSLSLAEQRIPVQEGSSVTVSLSEKTLNRIAVEGDRIINVKGTTGQFQLDKDPKLGQIFIQPTLLDKNETIQIFISTEKGFTYALKLLCNDLPAASIVLVPEGQSCLALKWEKSNSYEVIISSLIKAMHNQTELEGYSVKRTKQRLPDVSGANTTCLQSVLGSRLQGDLVEVCNSQETCIGLTEGDFYQPGIRAIAILHKNLGANEKTRVYIVRDRHA